MKFSLLPAAVGAAAPLAGCAPPPASVADPQASCAALTAAPIDAQAIDLPTRGARIDAATREAPAALKVAERAPTPAAAITSATPQFCKVLGRIAPVDASAPPILFQINLPTQWNGRLVQYGGGGFNGVLITGLALPPASRFDTASPLAQGYVTVGTDSGHQNQPGQPPQAFALNNEALVNFAHASYKKVRDVAVEVAKRHYGRTPAKLYFVGSSEGGREGLMMAQRYPKDFDGVFSCVPVINWTGLQLAGTRNGIATMGDGWLKPAQVRLVHDAVLETCDAADGIADGLVSDAAGCKARFDVTTLRCPAGASGDTCLSDAQVRAVQTLHAPYRYPFPFAHGVTEYPGWGISGENTPAQGRTGGWLARWLGAAPPTLPAQPNNGITWVYGSGAVQYFYARDPQFDVRRFDGAAHAARLKEISALMDATDPDLSAFAARGGKLLMLEYMADYAQSPYAGIEYYKSVVARMGQPAVDRFARLYTAPGVDHAGSGAPANVDMLPVLVDWVERGREPGPLTVVAQQRTPPFASTMARPLCPWPTWPRYRGSGEVASAASFECTGR
jgi:feruloyl esterase